jgi:hypothetical protein
MQKEMDDHLQACEQFLTESHIVILNMDDINDISFFGTRTAIIVVLLRKREY